MIHSPITAAGRASAASSRSTAACRACRTSTPLKPVITMAFQPTVDISTGTVFAYEALVRGTGDRSAGEVPSGVDADTIY